MDWAKEGRRIIPLLKRATPITALTPLANEGADSLASTNKNLASPINTKSETGKKKTMSPAQAAKYSQRTPPKDLSEMVTKVKDENSEDATPTCVVRTPPYAVPTPPSQVKQHTNLLGGDVMILPSGKAIRLNAEKLNEINEAIDALNTKGTPGKRKRKQSMDSMDTLMETAASKGPAYEVLSKNALMNMMPPPPMPPASKMGLLGQQLMTPPTRAITPRGTRRGVGSRGGRRSKTPRLVAPPPPMPLRAPPPPDLPMPSRGNTGMPMGTPNSISQHNLAMLAQAINHQQEQDAAAAVTSPLRPGGGPSGPASTPPTSISSLPEATPVNSSPKSVVVTTSSANLSKSNPITTPAIPAIITEDKKTTGTPPMTTTVAVTSSPSVTATVTSSLTGVVTAKTLGRSTPGPQTVKLKVGDSPMKVFPMGARILPKTASAGGSAPASGGSPVFMVATSSMSQNLMRVARTTNQTVTFTSGQRVVTVNTSGSSKGPGTAAVVGGLTLKPGATPATIKALQPRVVTSVNPGGHPKSNLPPSAASSKPSVIVVQRSGNSSGSATAITAKALVTKVRYRELQRRCLFTVARPGV